MKEKIKPKVFPVIQGFVFCAAVLQILFGMAYIGVNIRHIPKFQETTMYLQMADMLVIDEYTGLLYPLLIKLCKAVLGTSYQVLLYILQLAAGIFAAEHFAHTWISNRRISMLCAIYVNTIPFVAQAHVTILPHSFAFSCLVCMLLHVIKATLEKRNLVWREWGSLAGIYILLAQLGRAYLFAGGLVLFWAVLLQLFSAGGRRWCLFVAGVLFSIGIFAGNTCIYHVTQTPGACGRIQRSFASAFLQRAGINILTEKYMIYMPEEIRDTFSASEMDSFGVYPYRVEYEFGPSLEQKYGKERAEEIYMELGMFGLENATKDTIKNIAEDALAYAVPMFSYGSWQSGQVKGAVSWNYTQFISQSPKLSSAYARISYVLWSILFVLSLILWSVRGIDHERKYGRIYLCLFVFVGIYGLWAALGRADAYDYKAALLPMAVSYLPICLMLAGAYNNQW